MLFELRQYRMKSGQEDNWVKFFEEVIVPFQTARGMTILGSWTGEADDNKDLFVWIRRFQDEADRERLYESVYESDEWKNEIGPRAGELLERGKNVISRMTPTPHSNAT
jgi:hypothetical protein